LASKDQIKAEILKCGRDPVHFILKYCKIRHPVRGLIPFRLFDYQKDLLRSYRENRFNVILKARQLGISEVTAAYAVWMMLFHRQKNILVMATKLETAKNIIKKVVTALKNVPFWLKLGKITADNRMSVELSNGSVIKAISSSEDAGRSEALSLLIIDEAAFIRNMDELWTGLRPTVQAGGHVIMLSTPNGVGNVFHKEYTDAERGVSDFKATKLMWWVHPERNADLQDDPERPGFKTSPWFRKETKNMDQREIAQELECDFLSSGATVISPESISWLEENICPPIAMEHWDRKLFIWKKPEPTKQYFICCDTARGDGADNSSFHVFDVQTLEQVAEYHGQIPVKEYAQLSCEIGMRYNTALLVGENVGVGLAFIEHVVEFKYPNVYFSDRTDTTSGEAVNCVYGKPNNNDLIGGLTTSTKTRPLMIAAMQEAVRARGVLMHSSRFLQEVRTFIWNNGHAEAMRGYNDDSVMAFAMGVWIHKTHLGLKFADVEHSRAMLRSIRKDTTLAAQVEGASKDPDKVPKAALNRMNLARPENRFSTRGYGGRMGQHRIDYRWLLK
jgi:hypothetical protein